MRWCLVLSLLASMLPALARAQDGGSSVGDAAASFREGGLAFEAGRYEEALGAFRRAYELAPHDRVRFNVAVCLEELGRFREAAVEYEAAAASHQLDEPTRERARAARDAARARLATVSLQSAGAIVEVEIDGAVACATPCEVALDPGEHRVAYTDASGAHERRVRVESGGRLDLVLAEAPALALDVEPAREDAGGIDLGPLGISGIVLFAIGAGGAHNLHTLKQTNAGVMAMPVFPPSC